MLFSVALGARGLYARDVRRARSTWHYRRSFFAGRRVSLPRTVLAEPLESWAVAMIESLSLCFFFSVLRAVFDSLTRIVAVLPGAIVKVLEPARFFVLSDSLPVHAPAVPTGQVSLIAARPLRSTRTDLVRIVMPANGLVGGGGLPPGGLPPGGVTTRGGWWGKGAASPGAAASGVFRTGRAL